MKNRKERVNIVLELIRTKSIGSQEELLRLLADKGFFVTQATLSRDLKMLKVSKIPTERGTYMYILPEGEHLTEQLISKGEMSITSDARNGVVSIAFSNNIVVIKTRNGHAPGLAYDIDLSKSPEILGTIPGSNTVFAVLREDVTRQQAIDLFKQLLGLDNKAFESC
ncbi:MAG: hypothetical protein K2N03_02275 [Muribaculaceae bacterium]|nr:hypothetical protein [Muribaculaceae bacterium]